MAGIEQIPMMGRLTQFNGAEQVTNALNAPIEAQARGFQSAQFTDAMLARAVQKGAESPQAWDAAMQEAAKNGVAEASEYIGKWNPLLVDRLSSTYAARTQNPAALGGGGARAAGGGIAGGGGAAAAPDNVDLYAAKPEQLKKSLEAIDMGLQLLQQPGLTYEDYQQGIERIKATGHPEAEKFRNILSELNFGPESVRGLYDKLKSGREQIAGRLTPETLGLPERTETYNATMSEAGPVVTTQPMGGGEPSFKFAPVGGSANPAFQPPPRTGGRSAGAADATLNEPTLRRMAEQYLAGDKSVFTNLGRGAQGAANVVALREMVGTVAEERGMKGGDIARVIGEFEGFKAGQRTMGNRSASVLMAATEAGKMANLVLETSDLVDRTDFPSLNSLLIAVRKGTGDPNVIKLNTAINSFINIYARAIAPTGQGATVSDKDHAREMLEQAYADGQVEGAIDIMLREIQLAKETPGEVKKTFGDQMGYGGGGTKEPAPQETNDKTPDWAR